MATVKRIKTVSTIAAGTETLTVTTIVVTTTVTVQASGNVSESGVVTATSSHRLLRMPE